MAVLGSDNITHSAAFKFNINSADRVTIDSSGRILSGLNVTTYRSVGTPFSPSHLFYNEGADTGHFETFVGVANRNDTSGPVIALGRSGGTTIGSVTPVTNGMELGVLRFAGANGTNLHTRGAEIIAYVDGTSISTSSMPGRLSFLTTPTGTNTPIERMRIDNAGNITISTVGSFLRLIAPSTNFDLSGQPGATDFLRINANGTQRFQFSSVGSAFSSTGTWGTISDVRIKENIADATDKLEDLKKLRVVNYNLKSDPEIKQIGFVAQEIEEVFPSLVEITGDEGSVTNVKAVKTTVLVPILVKSLQEAVSKIEILEAKVEQLEAI
jgi:hypothetical protein